LDKVVDNTEGNPILLNMFLKHGTYIDLKIQGRVADVLTFKTDDFCKRDALCRSQ
jgi:hypothetical protein